MLYGRVEGRVREGVLMEDSGYRVFETGEGLIENIKSDLRDGGYDKSCTVMICKYARRTERFGILYGQGV